MPFQKGHAPMGGRPPKVVEDAKRSILLDLFDEQAERAIVQNMIANAKRKGLAAAPSATTAATWLWDRKYGKVKDRTELTGEDGAPLFPDFERALQKTYAPTDPPAE